MQPSLDPGNPHSSVAVVRNTELRNCMTKLTNRGSINSLTILHLSHNPRANQGPNNTANKPGTLLLPPR
eukprot:2806186-Lingulodinium_polyedra.AAC.1